MSNLLTGVSRVETETRNLSQTVQPISTTTGAIALVAPKGEIDKPILITSTNELDEKFGSRNPAYGFGLYAARTFLRSSASLYVMRAISGDYGYSSATMGEDISGGDATFSFVQPQYTNGNAQNPDTSIIFEDTATRKDAFYIRAVGPGSSYNLAANVTSQNMPEFTSAPVLNAEPSTKGSSLAPDDYNYRIVPNNALGNALPSDPAATAVTVDATNNSVRVSWQRISGASGYSIYRNDLGDATYYFYTYVPQVGASLNNVEFIDRGQYAVDTTQEIPDDTDPSLFYVPSAVFTLNIFDLDQSESTPAESFEVTFNRTLDGFGQQLGVEEKVNLLSSLVRVTRNDDYVPTYTTTTDQPVIYPNPVRFTFLGGSNGDAYSSMDSSAFIDAWDLVRNEEEYTVRIMIDGGMPLPAKLNMAAIARERQDCQAFFDTPREMQQAGNVLNYRKNVLNLNTDRAALYTPDLKIFDSQNASELWVPPSGHAAALRAAVSGRRNVWTSAAGLNNGLLDDVIEPYIVYSRGELNMLSDANINTVKRTPALHFPEQFTLTTNRSALSYQSVRAMVDLLQISIGNAYDYSLQEPNDDILVRELINLASSFLEPVRAGRGISRFEISAGDRVNPPAAINNAQRNIYIYIWPILPTRYIKLVMNVTREGVEFEELILSENN